MKGWLRLQGGGGGGGGVLHELPLPDTSRMIHINNSGGDKSMYVGYPILVLIKTMLYIPTK